jgi:hypothetical protein
MAKGRKKPFGHLNKHALSQGFRSGLELSVSKQLDAAGVTYGYESMVIDYIKPESHHRYHPDFVLTAADGREIIIEAKGRFQLDDRKKHLLIKSQWPDLDIRFVFWSHTAPISKGAKTTLSQWADRHGFLWAHKKVPKEWLEELK